MSVRFRLTGTLARPLWAALGEVGKFGHLALVTAPCRRRVLPTPRLPDRADALCMEGDSMRLVSRKRWATLPAVAALATMGTIAPLTHASAAEPDDSGVVVATGYVNLPAFPGGGPAVANLCVNGVVVDDARTPHVFADGVADPQVPSPVPPGPPLYPNRCVPGAPGSPNLHATFNYAEPNPPVVGFASGHISLTAVTDPDGGPTDDSEDFYWVRVG